ncbi:MAG: ATP-binding cassette domain-containing protein [Brachymonas sp.]|nr:ATP-binding cassette domain-containing protein [Brachymonas sp.]
MSPNPLAVSPGCTQTCAAPHAHLKHAGKLAGTAVQVAGLHCYFGHVPAVNNVSFQIQPGEHIAITGANGSGKSTLLRCLIGLHRPSSGEIRIGHTSVCRHPTLAHRLCAWVPQRQAVGRFPLRVHELLASGGALDAATTAAEQLGIGHLLQRPLSTLSGGQLQRAFIARAMGSLNDQASVLLADEPTAALDFAGQQEIAALIAQLPCTAVVVTHDRGMAASCDRVFEMAAGSLREVPR